VRLQTVCVRHHPPEIGDDTDALSAHNLEWVRRINASGRAFLSPSLVDDIWMARVSIGVESTERGHLEELIRLMAEHRISGRTQR
jgi:aromatic-L-amino-acid decarboxylase